MKNLKNIRIIVFLLSLILFFLSCEEKILNPELKGQIEQDRLFNTKEGFLTSLTGSYAPLQGIYNLGWGSGGALTKASDDGWTWRKESEEQNYSYTPTKNEVSQWWSTHYTGITRCNTILSRLEETEILSKEVKGTIEGQVKFLRALYYFRLVRLFGGIPLIVNEVTAREDAEKPRATIEDVYNHIKSDLNNAIDLLPVSYRGSNDFNVGMATKGSAQTLKAKVHLELHEWSEAATLAEDVVESGVYSLHEDYANNFYGNAENGDESIFEVQFSSESGGDGGNYSALEPEQFRGGAVILPTDANNDFGVSTTTPDAIIQSFESEDERKSVAVDTYGLPNFLDPKKPDGSLFYINKYYDGGEFQPGRSPFNFPVFRYSEVLLIAAEAINERGANNSDAIQYVNMVRNRADLPDLEASVTGNQNDFRQAIMHERRVELCFEQKRYFDLNRWGILRQTIAKTGVDISPEKFIKHAITGQPYHLFPLPASEFINNARLSEQNPGY